jgi:hypothetical protein
MPITIITHSRKDLVRKQKACINEVCRRDNPYDNRTKEAIHDLQRWSKDSKIFAHHEGVEELDSIKGVKKIVEFQKKYKSK